MYCPVSTGGLSALGLADKWPETVALRATFAAKLSCDSVTVTTAPAWESGTLIHADLMAGVSARSARCAATACSSSSCGAAACAAIISHACPAKQESSVIILTSSALYRWTEQQRR